MKIETKVILISTWESGMFEGWNLVKNSKFSNGNEEFVKIWRAV